MIMPTMKIDIMLNDKVVCMNRIALIAYKQKHQTSSRNFKTNRYPDYNQLTGFRQLFPKTCHDGKPKPATGNALKLRKANNRTRTKKKKYRIPDSGKSTSQKEETNANDNETTQTTGRRKITM